MFERNMVDKDLGEIDGCLDMVCGDCEGRKEDNKMRKGWKRRFGCEGKKKDQNGKE